MKKQIQEYLMSGGLFNPELMEHQKVQELILQCQKELEEKDEKIKFLIKQIKKANDLLAVKSGYEYYDEEFEEALSMEQT
jgi:hypothetical protein